MAKGKILNIISEDAYRIHSEYAHRLALRYSVLKKSDSRLGDMDIPQIMRSRIPNDLKNEAVSLLSELRAHELYFSSFADGACKCDEIRKSFVSENSFLYSLLTECRDFGQGFCFVSRGRSGISTLITNKPQEAFYDSRSVPILAVDLCEHAYFKDYGFEREEYLKRAFYLLDLGMLR